MYVFLDITFLVCRKQLNMKAVLFILDCSFDMEAELTPLESAINVLEMIKTEFTLTEAVVESSRKLVKEAVRLFFLFSFKNHRSLRIQ